MVLTTTKPLFDVQDRDLNIHKNGFLEASAGTGKTFAIVTLALRLLLEGVLINEILIVTFTKLATFELKNRLRMMIIKTMDQLKSGSGPDFVNAIIEKGENEKKRALWRLERALSTFDESSIFTIHSFCFQTLQKELAPAAKRDRVIRDTLQFHHCLAPEQLDQLLRHFGYDVEALFKEIAHLCERRIPIETGRNFDQISEEFFQKLAELKNTYQIQYEPFLSDLLKYAPCFEKMIDKSKHIKEENLLALKECAHLFSSSTEEFPNNSILLKMQPALRKKNAFPTDLHYPDLFPKIMETIAPLLVEAGDVILHLAHVAEKARVKMEQMVQEEQIFFYEDILREMCAQVTGNEELKIKIRATYRFVFIDEFQDTDALQWKIFSTLFNSQEYRGCLYLIGDPKQSIYRFRKADLYTYFKAKEQFCEEDIHDLEVNFRATPSLTEALNQLFDVPDFLVLPKTHQSFPYHPVRSPVTDQKREQALYFYEADEEEELFEWILETAKNESGTKAVLVKDRYQEQRFLDACQRKKIEALASRNRSLVDSRAYFALHSLLAALMYPQDQNLVAIALYGPIFGYQHYNPSWSERFHQLHQILHQKGLLSCFRALVPEILPDEFHSDLVQLVEILVENVRICAGYLPYLTSLKTRFEDDDLLKSRFKPTVSALLVQTIHKSKGLEYDVVFPLGLVSEYREKRTLVYDDEKHLLTASKEAFERHLLEVEAEQTRLLYVALTRAKRKLYIPLLKGVDSPIKRFLEKRQLISAHHFFKHEDASR